MMLYLYTNTHIFSYKTSLQKYHNKIAHYFKYKYLYLPRQTTHKKASIIWDLLYCLIIWLYYDLSCDLFVSHDSLYDMNQGENKLAFPPRALKVNNL
jgi:hypothetical protein